MTGSGKRVAPKGKPFQKGDPRINKGGSATRERAAWSAKFHNALAEKLTPDQAADTLVAAFKAKQSWAVQEVLERLMGKVTQPIEGELTHTLQFKFGNGDNGHGEAHE